MMLLKNFLSKILILLVLLIESVNCVNFKDRTSNIKVKSGASLILNSLLSGVNGTIEKEEGSNLEGEDISFIDGAIKECGNKIRITGTMNNGTAKKLILDGNKFFRGSGGKINQTICVSGEDNCLEGDFDLNDNNIEFQDSNTTLSTNTLCALAGNVFLNGGNLKIFSNLSFKDEKRLYGPGKIHFNGFKVEFGATDMSWEDSIYFSNASDLNLRSNMNLSSTWTFAGYSIINGNKKRLTLKEGGNIVVDSNSTLLIEDITIRNLAGKNIRCIDDTGKIIFKNTKCYLEDDFTFENGSFEVEKELTIKGEYTFTYASSQVSTIKNNGQLTLDNYVTFFYKPTSGSNNLISFESNNSVLLLEDAIINASMQGINFTVGKIDIKGNSSFFCENDTEGIIIGDNSLAQDCKLDFYAGSQLNLTGGALNYRNISCSSCNLRKGSYFQISSGGYLMLDTPICSVKGTIFKEDDGVIQGEHIEFEGGFFGGYGNITEITGDLDFSGSDEIILDGNKTFKGDKGKVYKKVKVSGKNNLIEGGFDLAGDIEFLDENAELTAAIGGALSGDFFLSGGVLYLQSNLRFKDDKKITGPGKIIFNGYRLSFGAKNINSYEPFSFENAGDIELNSSLNLSNTWTFSGCSIITGNSNILTLDTNGSIVIKDESNLLLRDVTILGVDSSNFYCEGDNSKVTFQNVKFILDDNFSFSMGAFEVLSALEVYGGYDFVYNSNQTSTIDSNSVLLLDTGVTFSYSPRNIKKDLIEFVDNSSILHMNGASLYTTPTGMQLKSGKIIIEKNSNFYSKIVTGTWEKAIGSIVLDEGITLGNDSSDDDFSVEILGGAKLKVVEGSLAYRNVLKSSWSAYNSSSALQLASNCRLKLHQILDLGNGCAQFFGSASLIKDAGTYIYGPVSRHSSGL